MRRRKTRGIILSVVAPNGDVTSRGWTITRTQEAQVCELLGPSEIETLMPAEQVDELTSVLHDAGLPVMEASFDPEAERMDAEVASGTRSIVGTVLPNGNVRMMIIYGPGQGVGNTTVAMVPNAFVDIRAAEFERWISGMRGWWEENRNQ